MARPFLIFILCPFLAMLWGLTAMASTARARESIPKTVGSEAQREKVAVTFAFDRPSLLFGIEPTSEN